MESVQNPQVIDNVSQITSADQSTSNPLPPTESPQPKKTPMIKLLVIISIVGVIAAVLAFAYLYTAKNPNPDAKRKADLAALAKALEAVKASSQENTYPRCPNGQICTPDTITPPLAPTYIKEVPKDPTSSSPYVYLYSPTPNGCTTICTGFILRACLENANDNGKNTLAPIRPCTTRSYQITNS